MSVDDSFCKIHLVIGDIGRSEKKNPISKTTAFETVITDGIILSEGSELYEK